MIYILHAWIFVQISEV